MILNEEKLKHIQKEVKRYLDEGIVVTKQKPEFTNFFLEHSKNFLNSARAEYLLSTDQKKSEDLGFIDYNGLIVVVNSSYYSMFHMARALLESEGIKIRTDFSIHKVTFETLVYFFYLTKKLEKRINESFAIAKGESAEVLGQDMAQQLITDLMHEKTKRSTFTYKMGSDLVLAKAKTSLNRAIKFQEEIKNIIK